MEIVTDTRSLLPSLTLPEFPLDPTELPEDTPVNEIIPHCIMHTSCWRGDATGKCDRCRKTSEKFGALQPDHILNPVNYVHVTLFGQIDAYVPLSHPIHQQERHLQTMKLFCGVKFTD